ncbi:NfeD family protein [Massilia sp. WF1]|uniref:NfeD family protein n=1 Tax=unclassified Massilia TaxID=2609279 RepID=UPI00068F8BE0|nr:MULTISPECIES: NfeD family protein [unclassified Massilia]ALK97656.1 NfeD family protein [Massilia sp. WG5]KNZ67765.1 NfeD family protein [Massilia sp. WF1]
MADWMGWLVAAGVLVILELFTGTFYLLMIAIGLAVGGVVALAGAGGPVQTIAAAAIGVLATALLHRSRFGRPAKHDASRDRNVNMDIGQRVTVPGWDNGRARVMYRGALWDVELGQGATPQAGEFRIVEVLGSRLVVANAASHP